MARLGRSRPTRSFLIQPALRAATGAVSLSRDAADAAAATDVATRAVVLTRTATNTATATDVATSAQLQSRSASDTATASDVATSSQIQSRTASDAAVATDAATGGLPPQARTATDAAVATDAATRSLLSLRSGSDTSLATDTATRTVILSRTASDTALATDDRFSITDDYNRTNSGTLGTTSDGYATWTDRGGSATNQIQIIGNTASTVASDSSDRVSTIPGGTAGTVQATALTKISGGDSGIVWRYQDSSNFMLATLQGTGLRIYTIVAGSVDQWYAGAGAAGDVLAVDFTLTGWAVKQNGSVVYSQSSTTLNTATDVGIYLSAAGGVTRSQIDNFSFTVTIGAPRLVTHPRTAADAAVATDSASRTLTGATRSASDTSLAADVATRSVARYRAAADTSLATDAATRLISVTLTASDTALASDSVATGGSRTAADAAAATDIAARGPTFRAVSDTALAADAASQAMVVLRAALDAATADDVATTTFRSARRDIDLVLGTVVPLSSELSSGTPVDRLTVGAGVGADLSLGTPVFAVTVGVPGVD